MNKPTDPQVYDTVKWHDASYSGHKGQGYHVQVMETFTETEDKDEKNQTLNLITNVDVKTACKSGWPWAFLGKIAALANDNSEAAQQQRKALEANCLS
jgi:hypothetical protein